jgi:hypothetical protein
MRALRQAVFLLTACGACGPALATGEWSPPTHVLGLEITESTGTVRIRTPYFFAFAPAGCGSQEDVNLREWSVVGPNLRKPDGAARQQMLEDLYLAFFLGQPVSLYVGNNPLTDCVGGHRTVNGVRLGRQ